MGSCVTLTTDVLVAPRTKMIPFLLSVVVFGSTITAKAVFISFFSVEIHVTSLLTLQSVFALTLTWSLPPWGGNDSSVRFNCSCSDAPACVTLTVQIRFTPLMIMVPFRLFAYSLDCNSTVMAVPISFFLTEIQGLSLLTDQFTLELTRTWLLPP